MRIQTILNRVEKFKSFVYCKASLDEYDDGLALVGEIDHTIAWRNGGLSLYRSGGSWSSWPIGCDE
jgi:hypothetical protein